MYDTIKITGPVFKEDAKRLVQRLSSPKENMNGYITGHIGNMRVEVSPFRDKVSPVVFAVISGSLPKLYTDSEQQPYMTREQTKDAIEKLSDCTGLNVSQFDLRRGDVSFNLSVEHPPREYIKAMSSLPRYIRSVIGENESAYFSPRSTKTGQPANRPSRTLLIYCKDEEFVRLEDQIKRPKLVLNQSGIWVEELYDPMFRRKCALDWRNKFNSIEILNPSYICPAMEITRNSMQDIYAAFAQIALANDPDAVSAVLSNCNKDTKSRAKKFIDRISAGSEGMSSQDLAGELRQKISDAYGHMVADL